MSPALLEQATKASPVLTYLSLFSLEARRDGSLRLPPSNGITEIAEQTGASIMLVISNLEAGAFSAELGRDILQSSAVQDLLLENIISYAEELGDVRAVMFDFEHLPGEQRVAYTQFYNEQLSRCMK